MVKAQNTISRRAILSSALAVGAAMAVPVLASSDPYAEIADIVAEFERAGYSVTLVRNRLGSGICISNSDGFGIGWRDIAARYQPLDKDLVAAYLQETGRVQS